MLDGSQIFVPRGPVPRVSLVLLSGSAHLILFVLILAFLRTSRPHTVPAKYKAVRPISATAYLLFHSHLSKPTQLHGSPSRAHRSMARTRVREITSQAGSASGEKLRKQAKQETAAITRSLWFRRIYGFSPTYDYQLAVQTAGEVPSISAAEVPPHFEQYVIVEITIDTDGKVAAAEIVAGMIDRAIEEKLVSAIRKFKYNPAKRDGVPVPSQRDIVIHIPS